MLPAPVKPLPPWEGSQDYLVNRKSRPRGKFPEKIPWDWSRQWGTSPGPPTTASLTFIYIRTLFQIALEKTKAHKSLICEKKILSPQKVKTCTFSPFPPHTETFYHLQSSRPLSCRPPESVKQEKPRPSRLQPTPPPPVSFLDSPGCSNCCQAVI